MTTSAHCYGIGIQLGIGGPVDLAHTPLTDEGGDVAVAESGADSWGHALC